LESTEPRSDPQSNRSPSEQRRAIWLLALGATLGLIAAAAALIAPTNPRRVPEDAVAIVNGVVIRQDDYRRLLAGFQSDSRSPINDEVRLHILDRMIEEELLVQRGLDLGLARLDRRVRGDLTSSLISSIVATAEEGEPEARELQAFYDANRPFFTRPGRLRVEQVFFRTPDGEVAAEVLARAQSARQALRSGQSMRAVQERWGDEEISPIPDTLLPALKLREYVGPTAAAVAEQLPIGAVSDPIQSGGGLHVLRMTDRTESEEPPLDSIRGQVENEWRRRAGDRALRAYLDQLREDGEVEVLVEFDEGRVSTDENKAG
jgi:hypothetical protein